MQEKCLRCQEIITDADLKIICFKCRKYFSNETKKYMSLGMKGEAEKLILSAPLDERWKRSMLEHFYPEFEQFMWRQKNEKRIQEEFEQFTRRMEDKKRIQEETEKTEKENRESKRQEAITNHRRLLDSLGIPYLGISPPNMKKEGRHRKSHCWRCHEQSLDNLIDAECNGCYWIICFCGGCGCGYQKMINEGSLEKVLR